MTAAPPDASGAQGEEHARKLLVLMARAAEAMKRSKGKMVYHSWYPQVRELMRARFPESAPCPRCEAAMGEPCDCFDADGEWIIQEGERAMRERLSGDETH